jgi:hypothetical protein
MSLATREVRGELVPLSQAQSAYSITIKRRHRNPVENFVDDKDTGRNATPKNAAQESSSIALTSLNLCF